MSMRASEPAFPSKSVSTWVPRIRIVHETPTETDFVEKIEPIEVLPSFNVEEFKQRLHRQLTDGDEEDEVTRVLVDAVDAGVWVVETARNGRVIVMRGTGEHAAWSG